MLKDLARFNPGLCVITTRYAIADLEHFVDKSTKRIVLENLSPQAGRQLLREAGVTKGTDKELESASIEYGGHALALTLLGRYIAVRFGGEIRERDKIKKLTYEKDKQGKHARNVMNSYEIWLQGTPELDLLYIMGLFDRPAPLAAIAELNQKPVIKGLTDSLQGLSDEDWDFTLQHLRDLRLLAAKDEHRPDIVDCHPLIREHFGEKLKANNPKAWQEAHSRLYDYYKSLPEKLYGKYLPDTLEEMEPLFAAVARGCQAGKYQEVYDEIYFDRINRKNEYYVVHKLGAMGSWLAVLSKFFDEPWRLPTSKLRESAVAGVLNSSGTALQALGRLREAVQLMQAATEMTAKNKDWENAARAADNLSQLYLTMGDVPQAMESARQSVDFADRSGDYINRGDRRSTLANALLYAGDIREAEKFFRENEKIQKENEPNYSYLYSRRGFQFCDLLLSLGQVREVLERVNTIFKWRKLPQWNPAYDAILDIALENLSLGRAYLLEMRLEEQRPSTSLRAKDYLNQAVAGLQEAGKQDYLPRGLFARAFLYRVQHNFHKAWDDLEEAREIAERGSMKLWLVDYHLEACRVINQQLAVGNKQIIEDGQEVTLSREEMVSEFAGHLQTGKEMVEKMGYGRRQPEILMLEAQLAFANGDKEKAREWLEKAKTKFDEMGIRQWDFEVAELEERLR
ncbi:MAG TPA: tetratricopeptide repeat protein [Desulfobacteria bacterium]|nr:tetratricopeptide repeat protein [Desulfobacteria bacterium]